MNIKVLIMGLLVFPITVFSQEAPSEVKISTTQVAPGIYRLFVDNRVAVVAQVGDDGILVVDAAYDRTGEALKEAIHELSDKPIRYLINTHLHGDHTGGNAIIGRDAVIISHPTVREFLSQPWVSDGKTIPPPPDYALPRLTIEGKTTLIFNDETIEIIPLTGGHTAGDLLIYFPKGRILDIGDLLFAGYFPYVDTANGGNPLIFISNLQWIADNFTDDITFIGGHGPIFTKSQLKDYLKSLNETMSIIKKAKSEGMTAEQMKTTRILKYWETFSTFFITEERWIDTVYPYL
jgi:glyoxylase-like metal-dependent hydrolase (beta-lactamase superfamily II)